MKTGNSLLSALSAQKNQFPRFMDRMDRKLEAAFLLSTDSARSFEIEFKFEFRDCYAYQPKPYYRLKRESF
jgi:hypothetical protein